MIQDYKLDSIDFELSLYLAAAARKTTYIAKPLILKAQFKNIPVVSDADGKVFEIDMTALSSFRDSFNEKTCKYVRLHDWEFNLKFSGKSCDTIQINCQHVALIMSKLNKKEIKDCNFCVAVQKSEGIQKMKGANQGFLNRLGKRNLVNASQYVAEEHFALINFVKKRIKFNAIQKISISSNKIQGEEDPLKYLNSRGKDLLEKLRHLISKQDLLNFVIEQEFSEEGEAKMRKIILSDVLGQNKKKTVYNRSIVETLQKSIRQ